MSLTARRSPDPCTTVEAPPAGAPPAPAPTPRPPLADEPVAEQPVAAEPVAEGPGGEAGDEPASALAGTVAAGMGLLVAPTTGRFRALVHSGVLRAGTVLGVVTGGRGRVDEVRVPVAAEICGLLALEGQIVQVGQALAWIRRQA